MIKRTVVHYDDGTVKEFAMKKDFVSSRSSLKQESTSFEGDVTNFFQKLTAEQEPLGREFEQVLFDNLWDLYQS